MSNNQKPLKGYNPHLSESDAFNASYGRRDFCRTASQVTDAQNEQSARRLEDLIQKCQNDLNEDCL